MAKENYDLEVAKIVRERVEKVAGDLEVDIVKINCMVSTLAKIGAVGINGEELMVIDCIPSCDEFYDILKALHREHVIATTETGVWLNNPAYHYAAMLGVDVGWTDIPTCARGVRVQTSETYGNYRCGIGCMGTSLARRENSID